jgi:hypothetical protein
MGVIFSVTLGSARGCGPELAPLAIAAVSEDAATASGAIEALRSLGPAGLQALVNQHAAMLSNPPRDSHDPAWQRLCAALDTVGAQHDCYASRLYWYTDFEQAKAAAKASGKPILSLRMLGKLTDEYSCANSRFFRTVLYANEQVSQVLRERFVLHWESVRPVPRITIDFGDGRKLERTITGNSIHYILDSDGRPVDALPGLYGPKAFLSGLVRAEGLTRTLNGASQPLCKILLDLHHRRSIEEIVGDWRGDLMALGIAAGDAPAVLSPRGAARLARAGAVQPTPQAAGPAAREAAMAATSKTLVELPLLSALDQAAAKLAAATDEETWQRIAALHGEDARLDTASRALMRRQNPNAVEAGRVAVSKCRAEDPLVWMVAQFERSVALDSVKNEYVLHRQIHEWFVNGSAASDVRQLNERVYAELFLTPSSDPWLGLVPADTYTALQNGGLACGTR